MSRSQPKPSAEKIRTALRSRSFKTVPAALMIAFEGNLKRLKSSNDVENVGFDLEDISAWNDAPLAKSDLHRAIPEVVRLKLIDLHREMRDRAAEIESIVSQLHDAVEEIAGEKEDEEDAARPRCETCHQPLPAARRGAR